MERNGSHQLSYSWSSLPKISAPLVHILRFINKSSGIPQALFILLLLCCILVRLLCCLFKAGDSVSYFSLSLGAKPTDY